MSDTAFYCRCGLRVQGSERLYHRCDPSLDEVTHVLFGNAPSMDIAAALSAIRGSSEAVQRATAWLLQQSAERLSSGGPTEGHPKCQEDHTPNETTRDALDAAARGDVEPFEFPAGGQPPSDGMPSEPSEEAVAAFLEFTDADRPDPGTHREWSIPDDVDNHLRAALRAAYAAERGGST